MKTPSFRVPLSGIACFLGLSLVLAGGAWAIPNTFIGNGFFGPVIPATPRFGANLTEAFLSVENWAANALPGPWEDQPALAGQQARRMSANPVLFGAVPDSVYAYTENGRLTELAITYLDAGTFFGYHAGGEKTRAAREAGEERRFEFQHLFHQYSGNLRERLEAGCGAGKMTVVGRSDLLRTAYTDYQWEGFTLRLARRDGHSVALYITRRGEAQESFIAEEMAALRTGERAATLSDCVSRDGRGDIRLSQLPVYDQGITPFCGIHSLAMVGHYLGLRIPAEGLEAGAEFRNTGSARGSRILELYGAVAEELGMKLRTSSRFDFDRARKAVEQGLPLIVWRRVSLEREAALNEFSTRMAADENARLPEWTKALAATLPEREKKGSPSHASVIEGVNPDLGEVIFSEPWGEHAHGRRMRAEEMEATAYAVFYFEF